MKARLLTIFAVSISMILLVLIGINGIKPLPVIAETNFTCTDIPQTECDALEAIYNSANGDLWSDHTGWVVSDTVCGNWYGVTCNSSLTDTHVTRLDLRNNGLTGSITTQLGNLSELEYLNLRSNQLSGNIPSTLGNLTHLVSLHLYYNKLTGTIPPQLGNLTNLKYLNLFGNQLTGTIPPQLGNLTNLTRLGLSYNKLTGAIPAELGNLTKLEDFLLADNDFTGTFPTWLGNLSTLKEIELYGSELSGGIPSNLGNLTNLETLILDGNPLGGTIPPELGNLTNLQKLYLGGNDLTGAIPTELSNLTNLRILYLNYNQLSGDFPDWVVNFTNLEGFAVNNNLQLKGTFPKGMGNLVNLKDVRVNDTQLAGMLPVTLTNLTALNEFHFHHTDLCEPTDVSFQTWLTSVVNLKRTGLTCDAGTIPVGGGTLGGGFWSAGDIIYTFPPGTFIDTVIITHFPLSYTLPSAGSWSGIGHAYNVSAVYQNTGQPAQPNGAYTVTIHYTEGDASSVIEDSLELFYWSGSQWITDTVSIVDTGNRTITAAPTHFSVWAVLGEADIQKIYLPLVLK